MKIVSDSHDERALTLVLCRQEIAVFRAAVERALFMDTPPHMQSAIQDMMHELLAQLPEA